MRVGEALAVIGATAAIGGGIGAYIELGQESDARETAIGAQACLNTYGTDKNGNISQDTLDCLKNGWIPGGHKATPVLKAGDPNGLYMGYIEEEKAKGSHVDVPPILAFTAGGLALGVYIVHKMEQDETPAPKPKAHPKIVSSVPKHEAKQAASNNGVVNLSK